MAHHRSWAKRAITESAAMEEAVQLAAEMTNEEDTLIIVTSDHTHTMSLNGYPDRGSNIFGRKHFILPIIKDCHFKSIAQIKSRHHCQASIQYFFIERNYKHLLL